MKPFTRAKESVARVVAGHNPLPQSLSSQVLFSVVRTLQIDGVPAPLKVAASLTAVEAVLLLIYAVVELFSISPGKAAVTLTTAAFFTLYGAALLICAWGLVGGRSWARSPVVLAQLIQLGVAWSFRGGDTTVVAVVLALVALIVVAGILHPASIAHLDDNPQPET